MLQDKEIHHLHKLVGEFNQDYLDTLVRNIEYYISEDFSIFIPIAGYCDYAVAPAHKHPAYMFVYSPAEPLKLILEGKKRVTNREDNLSVVSPQIEHQEIVEEGFNSYVAIFIDKDYFEKELKNYNQNRVPTFKAESFSVENSFLQFIKIYMNEFKSNLPAKEILLDSLKLNITHSLIRTALKINYSEHELSSHFELNNLIAYLIKNLDKKISLKEMAGLLNLSVSHFSMIFKKTTKLSPMQYLNNLRIEKAKRLIKSSDKNLTEIAFECGFGSSAYFSAKFIEREKVSPAKYRKIFKDKI